jgi:predicted phage tail protein
MKSFQCFLILSTIVGVTILGGLMFLGSDAKIGSGSVIGLFGLSALILGGVSCMLARRDQIGESS